VLLDSIDIDADLIGDGIDALELKRDYDVILVDLHHAGVRRRAAPRLLVAHPPRTSWSA